MGDIDIASINEQCGFGHDVCRILINYWIVFEYVKVKLMNFIPAILCPFYYHSLVNREKKVENMKNNRC